MGPGNIVALLDNERVENALTSRSRHFLPCRDRCEVDANLHLSLRNQWVPPYNRHLTCLTGGGAPPFHTSFFPPLLACLGAVLVLSKYSQHIRYQPLFQKAWDIFSDIWGQEPYARTHHCYIPGQQTQRRVCGVRNESSVLIKSTRLAIPECHVSC